MKSQILLAVALGIVLVLLGKVAYTNHKLAKQTTHLSSELMRSNLDLGRAETSFGNAQSKIIKLDSALQKEISQRDALVTRYGELQAIHRVLVKKRRVKNVKTVYIEGKSIQCKNEHFTRGLLYEAITTKTLLPLVSHSGVFKDFRVTISCSINPQPNSNRIIPMRAGYTLHQRFGGQLVETRLPNGGINHYVVLYEIGDKGKRLKNLKIEKWSVLATNELAPQWYWWLPRLDLGGFAGAGQGKVPYLAGSAGVSFMGFGKTKNDLSWRALRLSADFGEDVGIGFTPGLYNIGELVPLVFNMWVGPHISKGLNSGWTLGTVLGAQL